MLIHRLAAKLAAMIFKDSVALLRNRMRTLITSPFNGSDVLVDTMILAEDRNFRSHYGFDVFAILRAVTMYLMIGRISGASTIEQQLVRTLTSRYEKTLARKIKEIMLSVYLSSIYQKEAIAIAYLKVAYFGWRMNGIHEAAQRLRYDLRNLTVDQAAHLISLLKYPLPKEPAVGRLQKINLRARHIIKLSEKCHGEGFQDRSMVRSS